MKIKLTLTATVEYEIDMDNYPSRDATTPSYQECLAIDLAQANDDPEVVFNHDDAEIKVTGELLP